MQFSNGNEVVTYDEYDLMLLNIRSLTNDKVNQLQIESDTYKVKVICLTEIWSEESALPQLNNYKLVSNFSRRDSRGGGVGIWLNRRLKCDSIDLCKYCVERDFEACGILLKQDNNEKFVCILNVYRSPIGNFNVFVESISKVLDNIYKPGRQILLCGDFNVDPNRDTHRYSLLSSVLMTYDLSLMVDTPTRVGTSTAYTIDHIYTNFFSKMAMVKTNTISDHETLLMDLGLDVESLTQSISSLKRIYNQYNTTRFISKLSQETWTAVYGNKNFQEKFNNFYGIFMGYFLDCFQKTTVKCDVSHKSWVTDEIRTSSKHLKEIYSLKRNFSESGDLSELYRVKKLEHTKLVNLTKKNFYQNKINDSDNMNKAAWSVMKEITGKVRCSENVEIVDNNGLHTDPNNIANLFNIFFKNAPVAIANNITQNSQNINTNFGTHANSKGSMALFTFSESEVLNIVKSKIKNKMSSGPDEVPTKLLKDCIQYIITPLTHLVNESFENGEFPLKLKTSKIIPIYKKNNKNSLENYRPVSLNSSFSKIFEHCMLDRLFSYLKKYNILCDEQHGFTPGKSTTTAIQALITDIVNCMEVGECPVGIFCDLSRAFDCVQHDTLLERMYLCGIRGVVLEWFSSFLSNRTQFVQMDYRFQNKLLHTHSDLCETRMGVPQGSILGPVLFLIFINLLPIDLPQYNIKMYADDSSATVSGPSNDIVEYEVNQAVSSLDLWFRNSRLLLNLPKTHYVRFSTYQNQNNLDIEVKFSNMTLTRRESIKFLGVELDKHLKWDHHCAGLASKLVKYCFLIRNLKPVMDLSHLKSFYYAQVYSRLSYGIRFWGSSSPASQVFLCQKRIIRCMFGARSLDSCRPLFREHRILPLVCIYILEISSFMYQNRSLSPKNSDIHRYETRNKDQFYQNYNRLKVTQLLPQNIGIKIFNRLPKPVRDCNSLKVFRTALLNLLVQKCFYTIEEFYDMSLV